MFDDNDIEEIIDDDVEEELDESDLGDESATEQRIREASSKNQSNNSNNQTNVNNNQTNTGNINNNSNVNNKNDSNRSNHTNIGDVIQDAGSGIKNKGEKISQNAQKKEARAQKLENLGKKAEKISGGKIGTGMQKYAQKKQEKAQKQEELGNKIQNAGEKVENKGNDISKKLDNLNPINKIKEAAQDTANTIATVVKTATKVAIKHLLTFLAPFAIPILIGLFMAFIILLLIYALFNEQGITDDGSMQSEFYSTICYGNISKMLVDELSSPVEIRNQINKFEGESGFGIANGKKHNGVDLNEKTTGNVEGDTVKSVGDGVVTKSTFDNTYTGTARKGGWLEIEYNISIDNGNFKFDIIYGGLNPSSLTLKKGDTVSKEQEIGKIGSIADTDNDVPTLYFSYYDLSSRTYLDPTNVFVPCVNYNGLAGSYNIEGYPNATKIVNAIIAEPGIDERIKDEMHLAAILANVNVESVGSALSDPDSHSVEGGTGNGIGFVQWSFDRKTGLKNYAAHVGSTWKDTDIQAKYLAAEHVQGGGADGYASFQFYDKNGYYNVNYATYDGFLNATTGERATEAYCYSFERPNRNSTHVDRRRNLYSQWKELLEKSRVVPANNSINSINGAINDRVSRIIAAGGGGTTGILQSPFDTDGSVSKLEAAASIMTYDHKDGIPCGSGKTLRRSNSGGNCEYHGGNDYYASVGTPVYAVDGGTVIHSGSPGGGWEALGIYVALTNTYGGQTYTTTYQHLSSVAVQEGQTVNKGQLIGYSGNTGQSSGPHLHLEIIKGEFYCKSHSSSCRSTDYRVNPYDYIAGSKRGQIYFDGSRN